ncbi:DUF551 domain-containing protein [Klebsiella pneumoniae]
MTSKLTRERLQEIAEDGFLKHGESKELARMALAAMDSESWCLPLDYLQGHKDGLEWASQLAEANHPETGDWLYDDPIELAKAIRKGPDMPPSQPALDTKPVAYTDERNLGYIDRGRETAYLWGKQNSEASDVALYRHAQPVPVVPEEKLTPNTLSMYAVDAVAAIAEVKGWNACRAAMLAAAPQSPGSEPATVPGKWIPVSDRLPFDEIVTLPKPMGGPFLVAYSSGRVDITWFSCWQDAGGRCGKWDIENTTLSIAMKLGKVTHWMPLPAAPQEGK